MKRIALLACLIALFPGAVSAGEDLLAKSTKLLEKRHYRESAAGLRASIAAIDPARRSVAYLTMGTAYLLNAELHGELYRSAVIVSDLYLRRLAAGTGRSRSRSVDLFLGELYLEKGKIDAAAAALERIRDAEGIEPKHREIAVVMLGTCAFLGGNMQKAVELWSTVNQSDPDVKAELARAYSRARLTDRNPVSLCDAAVAAAKRPGRSLPPRLVKNALAVYVKAGLTEKGLDLIENADLNAATYSERVHRSKDINFYSISLLDDLDRLYGQASLDALEKAAQDPKIRDTVNYYLGEAYLHAGNIDQSMKSLASFIAASQMPQQVRDRAAARQAVNHYRRGKQLEAIGMWDDLAHRSSGDPDLLGEVLLACSRVGITCPKVVKKAEAVIEAGQGKKFAFLNGSIGKYYLAKRDYGRAIAYLEAGRDKGNKNKIESNDGMLLVSLADVYYRTKKFSEALEIYFEMSKQLPEVRHIQEPLQGIYSMEQKSAGDVKIN